MSAKRNLAMSLLLLLVSTGLTTHAQEGQSLAPMLDGMGVYSRPISTDSIHAQEYFDQGLNLTFGYYFVHAAASFQEAIRHDADNGMLYWGLALAISPNPNSRYGLLEDDPQGEGKKAIEAAMARRQFASPVERSLIEALHVRYDDETYPAREDRDAAYIEAMRNIYRGHPNDNDAGILLADAIMTSLRWSYWDDEEARSRERLRRPKHCPTHWISTPFIPARTISTSTWWRPRMSRAWRPTAPTGWPRSCHMSDISSTCHRTSLSGQAVTRTPSIRTCAPSRSTTSY